MSFFFWHVLYSFKNMSELSVYDSITQMGSWEAGHALIHMCRGGCVAEGEWSPAKALRRCVRPARSFVACHSFSLHALFSHLVDLLCALEVILQARSTGGRGGALCYAYPSLEYQIAREGLSKKKKKNRKIIKDCLEAEHKGVTCIVSRAWAWTHLPGPWPVIAKTILSQCIVLLSKAIYS